MNTNVKGVHTVTVIVKLLNGGTTLDMNFEVNIGLLVIRAMQSDRKFRVVRIPPSNTA